MWSFRLPETFFWAKHLQYYHNNQYVSTSISTLQTVTIRVGIIMYKHVYAEAM